MKHFRTALFALLFCLSLAVQGQSKPPAYQFLILIDSSSNMRRLDEITPTIVHDLVKDGIYGRMRDGDLYGVWTFSDNVDVNFIEPTTWQKDKAGSQAQSIDGQLRRVKYQSKAKLEEAIKRIKQVALQSDELTVLIIHDGSGVMFGTPYDLQITALYRQFYKDMSKNERPFITSFIVQDRKMTAWAVDAAGSTLSIPLFTRKSDKKETPATNIAAKATKPVELETKPEPPPAPAPKKPAPAPIIVKGPLKPASTNAPVTPKPAVTPAPPLEVKPQTAPIAPPSPKAEITSETRMTLASSESAAKPFVPVGLPVPSTDSKPATIQSSAPKATIAEPVVTITPSASTEAVKPSDIVPIKVELAKPETKPAAEVKEPVTSKSAPATVPVTAPPPEPANKTPATTAASKTVDTATQFAQTAVVVPPERDWVKIGLGLLCLAAAIIAVFFLTKRNQPAHGSVISRSMNRDR
ncbi:MAG TPA: hypothetical protein VGH19_00685 [Verrucomicrobiae bacterium]